MIRTLVRSVLNSKINPRYLSKFTKTYTDTDEWLYTDGKEYRIGLTQNAIDQLGELVYIEYDCEEGYKKNEDSELVLLESVKAANCIKAPHECIVDEINTEIENNLDIVNKNPEDTENSWFVKFRKLT